MKRNKKEDQNEHCSISLKRVNETVIGGKWKRENWIREQIRKWKEERTGTGVVRDKRGCCGEVYLRCARDYNSEGTKEATGVILAEMHGNEIWTLMRATS